MIDLEASLERPACSECVRGRIRPVEIRSPDRVRFDCPEPSCGWSDVAPLPAIRKTIVYLDTSTVINMRDAVAEGQEDSPWMRLYRALRSAAADEALCCTGSSVLREEAELGSNAEAVVRLSRDFGDPGVEHHIVVRERQILRALDAFLEGAPPSNDVLLDDAFRSTPHAWLPALRIDAYVPTPDEVIEHRRAGREPLRSQLEQRFREFEEQRLSADEIHERELDGLGEGIRLVGLRAIAARTQPDALVPDDTDPLIAWGLLARNTFDRIVGMVADREGLEYSRAVQRALAFLDSEHVRELPMNQLYASLYTELAMSVRGPTGRNVRPSDVRDIDHMATYMPYVDVFIADGYFLDASERRGLGERYSTTVRRLRPAEIDEFIEEIEDIVADAPHAELARRIRQLIAAGGAREDETERFSVYLRARGIDPDQPE